MRRLLPGLFIVALLPALPACALAGSPPAAIHAEVQARIVEAATEGMTPEEANDPSLVPAWMKQAPAKMFRRVDINGDKLTDWAVDYMDAPNGSLFCGSGGCQNDLYLGQADGTFRRVFSRTTGEIKLAGPKSARTLEANYHGSVCDSFGASECLRRYRWDAIAGRYVEIANSKGLAMLVGGSSPALYPTLDQAPPEARAVAEATAAACKAVGGAYPADEASLRDIPDINGDGVRDWVVGGPYDNCNFEGEAPAGAPAARTVILASNPAGGFTKAYEGTDVAWDLDIGPAPAQVLLVLRGDNCGLGETACPRRPLAWDAAAKALRPR
jgi:hypothetical protein